jgi:hypothetical protein
MTQRNVGSVRGRCLGANGVAKCVFTNPRPLPRFCQCKARTEGVTWVRRVALRNQPRC